jgi:hypothetical protein
MPVPTANGVNTLVVLVVEDEFFVRYGIATTHCAKRAMSSSRAGAAKRLLRCADQTHRSTCCSPTSISAARSAAGRLPNAFAWAGRMAQYSTHQAMRSIRNAVVPTVCLSPSRINTATSWALASGSAQGDAQWGIRDNSEMAAKGLVRVRARHWSGSARLAPAYGRLSRGTGRSTSPGGELRIGRGDRIQGTQFTVLFS